jgi:hypothetical protein
VRLQLHGVVRAAHPLGRTGASPQVVVWEDLAAVVSPLPDGRVLDQQDGVRHLEILSALVRDGPVLPMRFGTVAAEEGLVRTEVLAPAAARLRADLDRLEGLIEVHVYLRFDENAALRAVYDENPGQRELRGHAQLNERIRAGEIIAQRLVEWRRRRSKELLAAVSALARESTALEDGEHTDERWAFLVAQHELTAVRMAVGALTGVVAECVGPLPAYSFLTSSGNGEKNREPASQSRWGW